MKNNPLQRTRRRKLRKEATLWEIILWSRLKRRQTGHRFRRQHSIGKYIVDFYCPKKKLVVELDGGQHREQEGYDEVRTKYFKTLGIRVLRIWNDDVVKNMEGVMMKIKECLRGD